MPLLAAIQPPYIPGWPDLGPFIAEAWLIVTIVGVLLAPFFVKRPNLVCGAVTLAGLTAALLSLLAFNVGSEAAHEHFRGLLVSDRFATLWKVMLLLFDIGITLLWFSSVAPDLHEGDAPEFFTLLLSATLGMALMASTTNLLMVFMTVELASLPSYVLAGFRKTNRVGAEASLKYVLFGAVSSSIMAYGLSLLYGLFGTLQ
ncbi:MAG TPA: proton-conducting transporter membrane subunit, partial [Nitrospirales bacterium]|nr:proton-conducting transporter membrane subunit [Nitrospirales bacterium]